MKKCPHLIELPTSRRPGNALNVEIGTPAPRCKLKPPKEWPANNPGVLRWLLSGGTPLVLGCCTPRMCPLASERSSDEKETEEEERSGIAD